MRRIVANALERRFGWGFYRLLAGIAFAGCALVMACDVFVWFLVENFDPVSQTISDAGAGRYGWVADFGMICFAIGLSALTLGFVLRGDDGTTSIVVRIALVLLTLTICAMALYNEYGDGISGGIIIHPYLVTLWGVLVPFILWFAPTIPPRAGKALVAISRAAVLIWVLFAPFLGIAPDNIQGLYERALALIMVASVAIAAWQLFHAPVRP